MNTKRNVVPPKVGKLLDNSTVGVHCELCGVDAKMLVRTNRTTGHQFLGCPNYPDCKHTAPIPEDIKMWLKGATPFPGLFDPEEEIND